MAINSDIFIFICLPLFTLIYYFLTKLFHSDLLNKTWLIFGSLTIYGFLGYNFLIYIFISLFINYLFGYLILNKSKPLSKIYFISGVTLNICFWLFVKYKVGLIFLYNFIFETYFNDQNWIVPLGFGLITIQQISYLFECYKKQISNNNIIDYLAFSVFIPKLIAGPLTSYDKFVKQLKSSVLKVNYYNISSGIFLFFLGLSKKTIIADTFGIVVNNGFLSHSLNFFQAWIVSLCNIFYIYFDISAFTDMAIGAGLLFNIYLPNNFNYPFRAFNIKEFWNRWHITFTGFFMNTIAGSLLKHKTNVFIYGLLMLSIFLIMSIWHKSGLQIFIWGFLNAVALFICELFGKTKLKSPKILAWIITFILINISWLFFTAGSIYEASVVIKGMLSLKSIFIFYNELYILWAVRANFITVFMLIACFFITLKMKSSYELLKDFKLSYKYLFITLILIITSIILNTSEPFIYYGF